jgi:propanol-preferring alcohol dehydrogenase
MALEQPAPAERAPLVLADWPEPQPGPGQVRVRVTLCGVCRTDLHVVEGDLELPRLPIVPGHEVVGVVDALGEGVREPALGARVGVAWLQGTCGACGFCATERENLCERPHFTGFNEHGGYAEWIVVSARFAYALPDAFADEPAAPLLCAGIIGYRALKLSEVRPGERLGLYGFGASAHLVIQIARARGCEVFVSSLREEHRELARELGAVWVGGPGERPPERLHGTIVFAPAGEVVLDALGALERGGTCACAGIHMTPIPELDYDALLFGERTLRSVTANTRRDALELLDEAARIGLAPHTTSYPLEEANRALVDLKSGDVTGAAVLRVRELSA